MDGKHCEWNSNINGISELYMTFLKSQKKVGENGNLYPLIWLTDHLAHSLIAL